MSKLNWDLFIRPNVIDVKSYWEEFIMQLKKAGKIFLSIFLALFVVLGLTACGTKDSKGKVFKASLSKSNIMMSPDYVATTQLRANKNSTYTVEDSKGNDIQDSRKNASGKVDIQFHKVGKYTVIAKSDNGHVTKKLPVKVKPYFVTLNKTTSAVGPLQFQIKNVKYEQKTKPKKPNNDALFNMDNYASLAHTYYQVTVNYEIRNNGDQSVDTDSTLWSPIDDNGTEYQDDGSADSYVYDTGVGAGKIAPKSHHAATLYMISNNKFTVNNLKFNVDEIWANDDTQIGDGGVAQLQ
jgi:hypothetical protein